MRRIASEARVNVLNTTPWDDYFNTSNLGTDEEGPSIFAELQTQVCFEILERLTGLESEQSFGCYLVSVVTPTMQVLLII